MALPDDALKRQLLGDIAAQAQVDARDLTELWLPAAAAPQRGHTSRFTKDSTRPNHHAGWEPKPREYSVSRPRGRIGPASRADHATRLLLGNMGLWDTLSAEDHGLLCELPPPHGTLFTWLDAQWHEHGAQSWAVLMEGLRDHEADIIVATPSCTPRDLMEISRGKRRNLLPAILA